jgi:hypothetical protein
MPVPEFHWSELVARSDDATTRSVESQPIEIPPNKSVRAHVMIVGVAAVAPGFGGADCYISEYIQNGQGKLNQQGRLISGMNITEIRFKLDVARSVARAIMLVEIF